MFKPKRNRVVVTGMGVLAPNGIGLEAFWSSLLEFTDGAPNDVHRAGAHAYDHRRRARQIGFAYFQPGVANRHQRRAVGQLGVTRHPPRL